MRVLDGLFDSYLQDTRLLRLTTPLGRNVLLAEHVQGEERISGEFSFTITALALDASIALKTLLGQPALLELATAGSSGRRAFHGCLTRVRFDGADGGLARYCLTLEPWTMFLSRGRDSRVFQNVTVLDVLDAVFAPYRKHRLLAPAWRLELLDRSSYPVRSLVTQYQESDLAFALRLMSEEGLFYFFEHTGDRTHPLLGRHELVIADHNGAFRASPQEQVRYTQSDAVMAQDGIDTWLCHFRAVPDAVDLVSWDYRSLTTRPVGAYGEAGSQGDLVSRDAPGQYAYATRADGERIARRRLQALAMRREVYTGQGAVRTLAPGTTFSLLDHPDHDEERGDTARRFLVTRVWHQMRNNLSADERAAVTARVGDSVLDDGDSDRPMYRNRIEAVRAHVPFRTALTDEHGQPLHPRPTVWGQQTAIVVGPEGAVVHTDRDHRIKIQFHWQRGARSHSRLDHPNAIRHSGAPSDDSSGTWVRVATALGAIAGANWGTVALPRVGQEVLVDFLEGDIDRPVVIAALYNGQGARDAQYNQVNNGAGVASGNAPAWFPGESGQHAHAAVLSGLKSQTMGASQSGNGAYSQLVFDSSAGQERVSLQRHDQPHRGSAEVNLGYLRHQTDNQRLGVVGFGAEVKTDSSVALRAGGSLLLSTISRGDRQMSSPEASAQIASSADLAGKMANLAKAHGVSDGVGHGSRRPSGQQSHGAKDRSGEDPAQPNLDVSANAGLVAVTAGSLVTAAAANTRVTAGHSIDIAAGEQLTHSVKAGISLFTSGTPAAADIPNQETGIKLHAATGKLSCQSHSGATNIRADGTVTVASVNASVLISACKGVLLTAQGAGIRMSGGDIELIAPGTITFAASSKELAGPSSLDPMHVQLPPVAELGGVDKKFSTRVDASNLMKALAQQGKGKYIFKRKDGAVFKGKLDQFGRTQRIFVDSKENVEILVGDGEWEVESDAEYD